MDRLFDTYMARLAYAGCPQRIISKARKHKIEVIAKTNKIPASQKRIPFVGPIIKSAHLDYQVLLSMISINGKKCSTTMDPSIILDEITTPESLYWIYDVEIGKATIGKSVSDAKEMIVSQKRSPLTTTEVISLCTLTNVISQHFVWSAGSRYGDFGYNDHKGIPHVWLNRLCEDELRLDWSLDNYPLSHWGTPSCGDRS